MALDTSKAGQLVAEQMEAIENDYADQDGFELGPVITIVGIVGPDGGTNFRIRQNIGNPLMLLGALEIVKNQLLMSGHEPD